MFTFAAVLFYLSSFVSVSFSAQGLCPSEQYQVKGHPRNAFTRADGTFVSATTVKTYCKNKSKAYEYLVNRFQSGTPPTWPNKSERPKNWTVSEKERVIDAFEELPIELFNQNLKGIFRMIRSKDFPNPASNVDGAIVIYDSGFDSGRNLSRIIAHELAHQIYLALSDSAKQDYRRKTGWIVRAEKGDYYWERTGEMVTEDSKISREEDFANNVDHYLFDFDRLKKATPRAAQWIENHFGKAFRLKGK